LSHPANIRVLTSRISARATIAEKVFLIQFSLTEVLAQVCRSWAALKDAKLSHQLILLDNFFVLHGNLSRGLQLMALYQVSLLFAAKKYLKLSREIFLLFHPK
jgi:hypothetical protein